MCYSQCERAKTVVIGLDKSRIAVQLKKTGNTIFEMKQAEIEMEELKLPISQLNQLRREALEKFEKKLEETIIRYHNFETELEIPRGDRICKKPKVNLYVQKWNPNIDYSAFPYHEIYVPFKDLIKSGEMRDCIAVLPNVIEENYEKLIENHIQVFQKVKAVAIGHLSQIELLERLHIQTKIMADDTLNITNNLSEKTIKELGIQRFTMSPELDKAVINEFAGEIEKELVVYGRPCLMTSKYCPIGKSGDCKKICEKGSYQLKDRKGFEFPVVSDLVNCHAKIYHSKALIRNFKGVSVDFLRIDILDEKKEEIEEVFLRINSES